MPRSRTKSTREETNVSSFVAATTDFKSNVTFAPIDTVVAPQSYALLLTQSTAEETFKKLPFWEASLAAALSRAPVGRHYVLGTTSKGVRVAVGVVPTEASRHNAPERPDVIPGLIAAALNDGAPSALSVVSLIPTASTTSLIIAQAIAKGANKNFTAKAGRWEEAYLDKGVPVTAYIAASKGVCAKLQDVATGVQLCMRLVDAPTNLLDTTTFAEIAQTYAQSLGFGFSEIRGEDLREQGYGGIYGVGKAAEFPPALVTLEYKPAKAGMAPKDKIALVGKGIVYDTGGLSMKSKDGMCGMKADMGGAAALFSSFVTLVRLGIQREVSCVLCLADNAVGPRAQRPDDIVVMKSGITVELNNTDAEGRLVLGDGVNHACSLKETPALVLDMATLTGAQMISTGARHAAIFANDGQWERTVVDAGIASGDLAMPILYCPEFHTPEFASTVADHRNSVADRGNAQSSCAGMFIHFHKPKAYTGALVHVDMAGPASSGRRATGYGVALITQLFGDL